MTDDNNNIKDTDSSVSSVADNNSEASPPQPSIITIKPPSPEYLWTEVVIALNYLTRINFKMPETLRPALVRRSLSWFPVIGALIGLFGASVDWVMTAIGLPGIITSAFAIISMLWITRALHEEEFAALANQYGQTLDRDQKNGWLREERSVRYGTLAVILIIIMKIGAISNLNDSDLVFQTLIAACCWSRALMVVATTWLRPLEGDPVADYFQQPSALRMVLAVVIGGGIVFAVLGSTALLVLGISSAIGLVVALITASHLHGYNGPLLGTLQQVVELAVIGVILAIQ